MATVTVWLLTLAGVLVGALLGGGIALFVLRRGGPGSASLRHEFDDYRSEVAEHYAETARRVDALTHAYKAVYDHLEDGAYRLVGESELRQRLEDASHEPVTIEGIGQRGLQRPSDRGDHEDHDHADDGRADDGRADDGQRGTGTGSAGHDDADRDEAGHDDADRDRADQNGVEQDGVEHDERGGAPNERAENRADDAGRRT